ncbi:MAG: hypothetical protein [Wendovervirus sonii]|uniref:Uncharacterized protein n=1 Tax=phage Lak_Megaphage_Sonny TaxID=3109229 RepID=A0ABZ0Z4H4_9CAUD|nr:MAG: hypothetical protein [phage Lak_Megaphage_Sonny]
MILEKPIAMNKEIENLKKEKEELSEMLENFQQSKQLIINRLNDTYLKIREKLNEVTKKYLKMVSDEYANDTEFKKDWTTIQKLPEEIRHEWYQHRMNFMINCTFDIDCEACRECDEKCTAYANKMINEKYNANLI